MRLLNVWECSRTERADGSASVWKNEQTVAEGALGDRYKGERSVCSLIYYL